MRSVTIDPERVDDVFDALRHRTRRFVIADLDGRPPPVALDELAARAVGWGDRSASTDSVLATVEGTEIELHHRHLPMLDGVGFLDYRPSRRTIVETPDLGLPDGWLSDSSVEAVLVAARAE